MEDVGVLSGEYQQDDTVYQLKIQVATCIIQIVLYEYYIVYLVVLVRYLQEVIDDVD